MTKTTSTLPLGLPRYVGQTLNDISPCEDRLRLSHDRINIYCLARLDNFITYVLKVPHAPNRLDGAMFFGEFALEAHRLSSFFRDIAIANEAYSPHLAYAPHLALFFEVFRRHKVSQIHLTMHEDRRAFDEHNEVYNNFYITFRNALHAHKTIRAEFHNWRFANTENQKKLNRYIDQYIQKNSDVTALHFTLFHTTVPLDLTASSEWEQKQNLNQLSQNRETFFNGFTRKTSLFPHKPGYVWAIDPFLQVGYGMRITLFFNTFALSKDHSYSHIHAHEIGRYWVSKTALGRGSYCLHPARKGASGPAFDRIKVDKPLTIHKLKQELECMAFRNTLVRIRNQPAGKFFGTPRW